MNMGTSLKMVHVYGAMIMLLHDFHENAFDSK